MKTAPIELATIVGSSEACVTVTADEIRELAETQLAYVGGGNGEVIFG